MTNQTIAIGTELRTTLGRNVSELTMLAIRSYAVDHPDAAAGLMHELTANELRMRLVVDFGAGKPFEIAVIANADSTPPLEVAHMVLPKE